MSEPDPSIDPRLHLDVTKIQVDVWWRQYDRMISPYERYLDLALRLAIFIFAICGGITSYVLANATHDQDTRWALLVPMAMLLGFAIFFCRAAGLMPVLRKHVFELRGHLGLGVAPDLGVLTELLCLLALLFVLVAAGLGWLVYHLGQHSIGGA